MANTRNKAREERIVMEIVVDAYNEAERAMGWYCYLQNALSFPFTATCFAKRAVSPLRAGGKVEVLGMAPEDECAQEMWVMIRWEKDDLAVPLAQLRPQHVDPATKQVVQDWHYWVKQGYEF